MGATCSKSEAKPTPPRSASAPTSAPTSTPTSASGSASGAAPGAGVAGAGAGAAVTATGSPTSATSDPSPQATDAAATDAPVPAIPPVPAPPVPVPPVPAHGDHVRWCLPPPSYDDIELSVSKGTAGIALAGCRKSGRVFVVSLLPGRPAEQAGVKENSELLSMDGKEVNSKETLAAGLAALRLKKRSTLRLAPTCAPWEEDEDNRVVVGHTVYDVTDGKPIELGRFRPEVLEPHVADAKKNMVVHGKLKEKEEKQQRATAAEGTVGVLHP